MEPDIEIVVKATRSPEGYNVLFANRLAIGPVEYETPRIVRCRDCEFVHVESGAIKRHWCDRKEHGKPHAFVCHPNGFCSWGKPREKACRNADENAAAFADAPTLESAHEPMRTPLLELGA